MHTLERAPYFLLLCLPFWAAIYKTVSKQASDGLLDCYFIDYVMLGYTQDVNFGLLACFCTVFVRESGGHLVLRSFKYEAVLSRYR